MANVWFTSDTHFGHKNILHKLGKGRPFETIEDHDQALIDNWNSVVNNDDVVFHLGDFNYKSSVDADFYLKKLNGKKFLIIGNHDNQKTIISEYWEVALPYQEVELNGKQLVLCHYPIEEWNGYFRNAWMIHGHLHGRTDNVKIVKNRVDAAVDNFNYKPVSFNEIIEFNERSIL